MTRNSVGLPGDRISIRSGAAAISSSSGIIRIPSGEYFKMKDNRGVSDGSRFRGPIRGSWIVGQLFFAHWPLDRIGFM